MIHSHPQITNIKNPILLHKRQPQELHSIDSFHKHIETTKLSLRKNKLNDALTKSRLERFNHIKENKYSNSNIVDLINLLTNQANDTSDVILILQAITLLLSPPHDLLLISQLFDSLHIVIETNWFEINVLTEVFNIFYYLFTEQTHIESPGSQDTFTEIQNLFLKSKQFLLNYTEIYQCFIAKPNCKDFIISFIFVVGLSISNNTINQDYVYTNNWFDEIINSVSIPDEDWTIWEMKTWFMTLFTNESLFCSNVSWALKFQKIYFDIILMSEQIIEQSGSYHLLHNAVQGLSNLSLCTDSVFISNWFKYDIISKLMEIPRSSEDFVLAVLKIIGNLICNNDVAWCNKWININCVDYIKGIVSDKKRCSVKWQVNGLWAWNNIFCEPEWIATIGVNYKVFDWLADWVSEEFIKENPMSLDAEILNIYGSVLYSGDEGVWDMLMNEYNICKVCIRYLIIYSNKEGKQLGKSVSIFTEIFEIVLLLLKKRKEDAQKIFWSFGLEDWLEVVLNKYVGWTAGEKGMREKVDNLGRFVDMIKQNL